MYPERFATGVRNTTIPNPALVFEGDDGADVFQGVVEDYNFKRQSENFLRLQKVLKANDTELGPIAAATYDGNQGYQGNYKHTSLTRFVSCSKDGRLMWAKYEGKSVGGGQNYVYVAGMRLKLTDFLAQSEEKQRALLSGHPTLIALLFSPDELRWLNNAAK